MFGKANEQPSGSLSSFGNALAIMGCSPPCHSQDADVLMTRGGLDAPTLSQVTEKFAQQDLKMEAGRSVAVILNQVTGQMSPSCNLALKLIIVNQVVIFKRRLMRAV
jgi:hypothetical protein